MELWKQVINYVSVASWNIKHEFNVKYMASKIKFPAK